MQVEHTVLANLCHQPRFVQQVLPYLEMDFFSGAGERAIFALAKKYIAKYRKTPSFYSLRVELDETALPEMTHKAATRVMEVLEREHAQPAEYDWLMDSAQKWATNQKTWSVLQASIQVAEKGAGTEDLQKILAMMRDAAGYGFKSAIGHDWASDADKRWDYYHKPETKVPFALDTFNYVTDGGFSKGTLNLFLAGLHVGKTMLMCALAADNLRLGRKVLYVTLEMKEEEISSRIDANLLDVGLANVRHIAKDDFKRRVQAVRERFAGQIKVKQYPGRMASAENIRSLMHELELKEGFIPDVIYVDYLQLLASSTMAARDIGDTYNYVGNVAVELRAIAQEKDVILVSAVQVNRANFNVADFDVTGTSESFQVPQHADSFYGLAVTPELLTLKQIKVLHLKSRYTDKNLTPVFMLGVDRDMQRFYDLEPGTNGIPL